MPVYVTDGKTVAAYTLEQLLPFGFSL